MVAASGLSCICRAGLIRAAITGSQVLPLSRGVVGGGGWGRAKCGGAKMKMTELLHLK